MNPSNLIPLSDVDPVVANNLGWEIDSISDKELVTIVKKAIVYSEVTIPKSEYLKARDLDELGEHFYNNIEPKMETDDVMEDFGNQHDEYVVFEGDVSSMTDDVIAMSAYQWRCSIFDTEIEKVKFC